MTYITGQTNRRLGNKEPLEYLPDIERLQGKETLRSQVIPEDLELLKLENYRKFLLMRREALAACMNEFIREAAGLPAAS